MHAKQIILYLGIALKFATKVLVASTLATVGLTSAVCVFNDKVADYMDSWIDWLLNPTPEEEQVEDPGERQEELHVPPGKPWYNPYGHPCICGCTERERVRRIQKARYLFQIENAAIDEYRKDLALADQQRRQAEDPTINPPSPAFFSWKGIATYSLCAVAGAAAAYFLGPSFYSASKGAVKEVIESFPSTK